jgi:hypothetical protein
MRGDCRSKEYGATPTQSGVEVPLEWQPIVSGNARLILSPAFAANTSALRMDFDFKGAGGFVVARRAQSRTMPAEYAVTFRLRGRGTMNNLELKLVDSTGQNVWRHVQKDLRWPARWKRIRLESRDIDFAWGPAGGGSISNLGSMEIAIVAGEGGKGSVWIADVQIEDCTPKEAPQASASSEVPTFEAGNALTGSGWKPRADDRHPWIAIDSIEPRTLGGVIIDWLEGAPASGFRVRVSMNGVRWKTLHDAIGAGGKHSYVYLPGLRTRFLRVELKEPSTGAALRLQSFEFSRSIHAFWHNVAAGEARGWHPRWLHAEQSVWTPIGRSNGIHCALMNDDGMVEVDQGSFSIEPMLWTQGKLHTWTDLASRQELQNDWMPVPSVIWETADWRLRVQAEAAENGEVRVRYRVTNPSDQQLTARLFVLVRPFQVTPPWQSFRKLGGVSPVYNLSWREGEVRVNGTALIVRVADAGMIQASGFGALRFDEGFMASHLQSGVLPTATETQDSFGFATGALMFDLALPAHQECDIVLECAGAGAGAAEARSLGAARPIGAPAFDWSRVLRVPQWAGNGWITDVVQAALTATAHILVTRSGPALQPGPRRYTRSWIRDGAMMSAALLRMGRTEEVREFIRWYAPHQRADGFVPCCVDSEGIDWLVEHDSHGELLALIADYYRFTADAAFLKESWAYVDRAVACIEGLLGPDGLLPISVSHEGYLAQPVHSYWDDFWALRGLRDAAELALAMGHESSAQKWRALSLRVAASLFASIEDTRARRKLDFIPASIEWADFDPTATANAIYLFDVPDGLDRKAVEQTFDKYLADWRGKRNGTVPSANYTPYEIRIIGALVRLGRRDAALELLKFFLSDRRPVPWNQWPEIAWRDHKAPAHLGDLPHTWIAAEYVLAVRGLFAYEREAEASLILAAGLASEWIDGGGVRVDKMPTLYGALSYTLRRMDSTTLRFEVGGGIAAKIVLRPPLGTSLRSVVVNGSAAGFDKDSVTVLNTPADVICTTF